MIAQTIAQKLGRVCLAMLGAHTFIDLKDGLQFRLRGCERINCIQIILDPYDTYTVKFCKVEAREKNDIGIPYTEMTWETVSSYSDIYFDMLHDVIVCNTATLFSCLFYGAGVNTDDKFIKSALQAIRDTMEDEGLEDIYLGKIVPVTGSISFGKSLSRQVTGSVTEQINAAKSRLEDPTRAPHQVAALINDNLLSCLGETKRDYGHPREAFLQLCHDGTPPTREPELPPNVL